MLYSGLLLLPETLSNNLYLSLFNRNQHSKPFLKHILVWSYGMYNSYHDYDTSRKASFTYLPNCIAPLRWRHNGHDGVSNHQPHHCLLNRLFGCRSKKISKLRVTGLCAGNSSGVNAPHKWPVTRKMSTFDDVIMPGTLIYLHSIASFSASICIEVILMRQDNHY